MSFASRWETTRRKYKRNNINKRTKNRNKRTSNKGKEVDRFDDIVSQHAMHSSDEEGGWEGLQEKEKNMELQNNFEILNCMEEQPGQIKFRMILFQSLI